MFEDTSGVVFKVRQKELDTDDINDDNDIVAIHKTFTRWTPLTWEPLACNLPVPSSRSNWSVGAIHAAPFLVLKQRYAKCLDTLLHAVMK